MLPEATALSPPGVTVAGFGTHCFGDHESRQIEAQELRQHDSGSRLGRQTPGTCRARSPWDLGG